LKTSSSLPFLSPEVLVNMEPTEVKQNLGIAIAQTYQLLHDIEIQLKAQI
jgi:hypothetical protein